MLDFKVSSSHYCKGINIDLKERILRNFIYNKMDFVKMEEAFSTGNLSIADNEMSDFLKNNKNGFKYIKGWDFDNDFESRIYIIDFILKVLYEKFVIRFGKNSPVSQFVLSMKHLLEEPPYHKNSRKVFAGLVEYRNTIYEKLVKSKFVKIKK